MPRGESEQERVGIVCEALSVFGKSRICSLILPTLMAEYDGKEASIAWPTTLEHSLLNLSR